MPPVTRNHGIRNFWNVHDQSKAFAFQILTFFKYNSYRIEGQQQQQHQISKPNPAKKKDHNQQAEQLAH